MKQISCLFIGCLIGSLIFPVPPAKSDDTLTPYCSFRGLQNSGRIGYYLSAAGDVDDDGKSDFMIGSYHTSLHGWNSGAVFLMLGRNVSSWRMNTSLSIADAIFRGKMKFEMVGYNMAGEGDFNGDGIDDLLIGGPGNWESKPPIPGSTFIIFGKRSPHWGDDFVLADSADKVITGESDLDQFGYAVSFIGDINHDGCDDILCAAPFQDNNRSEWAGKVYLILGSRDPQERVSVVTELAVASFIYPAYHGTVGSAVTGVRDVNQDGYLDFAIGAAGIGTCFLVLGRPEMDWGFDYNLTTADCIFYPEHRDDDGGWQVKSAGDVNKDGFPDFLISGLQISSEAGKVYVIFGRKIWPVQGIHLSQADASYIGEGGYHQAGVSINNIKDFDGDGIDDFIIGARYHIHTAAGSRAYHRGKSYIIQGKKNGWRRDVSLNDIAYYWLGEDSVSCSGWGVSSAGDVNGDFRNDIIISAPWNDDGRTAGKNVGEVYLFLGNYQYSQITGRTWYRANEHPVPGVAMSLSGDKNDLIYTDAEGKYSFQISYGSDLSVSPAKNIHEDVEKNSISIFDAALTALHAVNLDTLNALAQVAADVNLDGKITIYDAALIAYYAVNLPADSTSRVGAWRFDPEIRHYQLADLPLLNEDYRCILLGEVSGNWKSVPDQKGMNKQRVDELSVMSGERVTLPIGIQQNEGFLSAEINLAYDADVLEFQAVRKTSLTEDFQCIVNEAVPGEICLGMYGFKTVQDAGDICLLDFNRRNLHVERTIIDVLKFQVNENPPLHYAISLQMKGSADSPVLNMIRNYPNPFNPETMIAYGLKEAAHIELIIYDILGRRVMRMDAGLKKEGHHQIYWNGQDEAGKDVVSGIYFAVLKSDEFIVKHKMIKLN